MLVDDQKINGGGHCGADNVCQRLGVEGRLGGEQHRQHHAACGVQPLPEHREHKGFLGLCHGGETVHKHILKTQGNNHQGDNVDGPDGEPGGFPVGGEQPHKKARHQPGKKKHGGGKQAHELENERFRLTNPVSPVGTVVEAQNGLGAAADAQHGSGNHQQIALGNGGAGDEHIPLLRPAVGLQGRIHENENQRVGGQNHERGKAQTENPPHNLRTVISKGDGNVYLFPQQKPQGKGAGGKLGNHRGNGGSGHIHFEHKDKHRVQNDVGHGADENGRHPRHREALAVDIVVETYRHQGEKGTGGVNGHVGVGVGKGDRACPEPHEQLLLGKEKNHRQGNGNAAQQEKGVCQHLPSLFPVPLPQMNAHNHRAPQTDEGTKGGQEGHNGTAHPHPRQGQIADFRDMTNVNPVDDAV